MSQKQLTIAKERLSLRHDEFKGNYDKFIKKHNVTNELANEILSKKLEELIECQSKEETRYKAAHVLIAYIDKCFIINDEFNCIQYFFPEALITAEKLDNLTLEEKNKMPMFGIPFSVKGNFLMPGYPCDLGLAKRYNQIETKKNSIVEHFETLGGIPFCFTTVPQALISLCCSSPLYGITKNPYNKECTPGGSSGGEACLLATGGIPFGIGSDLAGSIRIPASMCGVAAMKPCKETLVGQNSDKGLGGISRLTLCFGFFTKHAYQQEILWKIFFKDGSYCKKVPFNIPCGIKFDNFVKPTKVAYFKTTGFIDPVPSNRRALEDVLEVLKNDGCKLVEFILPPVEELAVVIFNLILPDNGTWLCDAYKGEVVDEYIKPFFKALTIPEFVKRIGSYLAQWISPQVSIMASTGLSDTISLRKVHDDLDKIIDDFIRQFQEEEFDFVICPQFPVPGIPYKNMAYLGATALDMALWNACNFPAGVLTTDKVNEKDIEELDKEYQNVGWNFVLKNVYEGCKHTVGMPIGVQVISLPYQEGKLLQFMTYLEKLMTKKN
ncbi:Fatty-acid amide hydrolase 1 [Strongyloides ratti]|uniref:Fatty-acid amide hydrolase 1 n=1 Tax=Strongyloides ratti TaxID=34506 RepID=A0A090LT49_STRRB|nr:Fatty-acid amide hydrolase 1 [Strongyloides ratti]CEF71392.1 Fatty-acid amide hydrolase 1 [Strongyloides ratti]